MIFSDADLMQIATENVERQRKNGRMKNKRSDIVEEEEETLSEASRPFIITHNDQTLENQVAAVQQAHYNAAMKIRCLRRCPTHMCMSECAICVSRVCTSH